MISIVKGKTKISHNLQRVLNPFFPLSLAVAEGKGHSENGLFDKAHRKNDLYLERIQGTV